MKIKKKSKEGKEEKEFLKKELKVSNRRLKSFSQGIALSAVLDYLNLFQTLMPRRRFRGIDELQHPSRTTTSTPYLG